MSENYSCDHHARYGSLRARGLIVSRRVLRRRGRGEFEAPASIRIARVRRSPVEPKEYRFSIEKVAATQALFSAFRRRRTAPLDISDARLVDRTLGGCQHHVVCIADGLEDVDAADTRLTRDVHGPIGQLGAENDHLRNARFSCRLVSFEDAQRTRTPSDFRKNDLIYLAR